MNTIDQQVTTHFWNILKRKMHIQDTDEQMPSAWAAQVEHAGWNSFVIPYQEWDQKLDVFILLIYITIRIQNAILLKIHFSLMTVNTHLIR